MFEKVKILKNQFTYSGSHSKILILIKHSKYYSFKRIFFENNRPINFSLFTFEFIGWYYTQTC
jgi:hypothetical protein